MEHTTSDLLQRLSESATIAMARKARELKNQGIDVISLSLGEPDFDTPAEMKQAGMDAIEANETHYTPVPGTPRIRKAIVEKFKRDNGLEYTMEQVVVSTGAKQSLANVVLSLVNPGDEVILPAPYWVSYEEIVKVAGGIPMVLPTSIDNDYKIQPSELEAAITPKTRMVMYSSPCNPSGSVYTEAETAALADVLRKHDQIITVSDEIYELINFTDKHASMAAQPKHVGAHSDGEWRFKRIRHDGLALGLHRRAHVDCRGVHQNPRSVHLGPFEHHPSRIRSCT